MQDDKTGSAQPEPDRPEPDQPGHAGHLDPQAVPAAHDDINGPGMTNGVPDQVNDAEAAAGPAGDRQRSETAAGASGGTGS